MDQSIKTRYSGKLKQINKEDLKYVEKDLEFYEKVSIGFLLFGSTKSGCIFILQKLIVLSNNRDGDSDILYSFASTTTDWRIPIIEALAVIKANMVLRKLGFDKTEIHVVYLPHLAGISVSIHPILKTLYILCERLTVAQLGRLVLESKQSSTLQFYDHSYVEIFLLDWINRSAIDIGDLQLKRPPNLDILVEFFKAQNLVSLNDCLLSAINLFTRDLPSPIANRNENDSTFRPNIVNSASSSSFEGKESVVWNNYDMSYKIRAETAGFILIFNQMNFHRETNPELQDLLPKNPLRKRMGSDVDQKMLESTFATFGYKPIIKNDRKHYEILPIVSDFVKRSIAYDSLIVCILSHGAEGVIYGSNSIPVEISKIEHLLTADSLLNKPKVLVVQACQGDELQEARRFPNLEYDRPNDSAAALADMLIVMSTVPGFASVRHKLKGTWLIQSLCKQIDQFGDTKHISDILTFVFNDVQSKRGYDNECMVPKQSSTLKKHLYLPKRY